mgnify:CR=1 FL=1
MSYFDRQFFEETSSIPISQSDVMYTVIQCEWYHVACALLKKYKMKIFWQKKQPFHIQSVGFNKEAEEFLLRRILMI